MTATTSGEAIDETEGSEDTLALVFQLYQVPAMLRYYKVSGVPVTPFWEEHA